MSPLRLAFMGSPDFAVPALEALHQAGHDIAVVYTQPPRPAGRGQRETPCPVHRKALELGLPTRHPVRLRRDEAEHRAFADLGLDAAVVAAYGLILPSAMLSAPRRGCLNIHASLLPRWRGAAPIQAAILAGDTETGITIMQMDEGLDTGPMLLSGRVPIRETDGVQVVHDALAGLGCELILRALEEDPPPVPQPEDGATYAPKLSKADGQMPWSEDATALARRVRALNPWPGTFFLHQGQPVRVTEAVADDAAGDVPPGTVLDGLPRIACGRGALRLLQLQRPGRASQPADAFLRGYALPPGTILG
ncbi:methionyl-tRNA formyltransferase [Teichococcus oryzae]|uniref:Methionyl-tRNA formyltransferase n=1 Tax=Teichococcus oryzae TaxID=1608942 RepID=A0A5B2TMC5_9PROT|nr:methionyl-tRNA formyltransferase [Pseudoroseomonas oryzae]KAA2215165.1 methionyl-tRNA formyltransferase [Pseudoroseomonas oryzae]